MTPLGTCFAVGQRKFATAAHVTGPTDEGLTAIVGRADNLAAYQDTTDQSAKGASLRITNYDPIHDICILELVHEGVISFGYQLGGSDMIAPGAPVQSLGYPHADHGRLVLTQQSSMVGARILLGSDSVKIKHVVLNTQTRPGQSGGPVFTADGRYVCAMIVGGYAPGGPSGISLGGIDPQTLHQTTHAISAEYITGLL
jgi:S1-C subfamily serine protease